MSVTNITIRDTKMYAVSRRKPEEQYKSTRKLRTEHFNKM